MRPLSEHVACYSMQIMRLSNLHRDHELQHELCPTQTLSHLFYDEVVTDIMVTYLSVLVE